MIQQNFIEAIAAKIKLGWFWKNIIRMALEKSLDIAMDPLHAYNHILYGEVLQMMQKYVEKDKAGMIDQAADVLAEIVKILFYPTRRK